MLPCEQPGQDGPSANLNKKAGHHNMLAPAQGGLLFGYFLLAAQEKVPRLSGRDRTYNSVSRRLFKIKTYSCTGRCTTVAFFSNFFPFLTPTISITFPGLT